MMTGRPRQSMLSFGGAAGTHDLERATQSNLPAALTDLQLGQAGCRQPRDQGRHESLGQRLDSLLLLGPARAIPGGGGEPGLDPRRILRAPFG